MKPKLKNSVGLVLVFSILVKGIGAVIEIIIQWLITQKIGISGYGDYTFYINCADISFWCLFSGIVKCNTFYLSDRNQSISLFKRKYFLYFMLPIILIALIAVTFFKRPVLYAVIVIVVLQFAINDRSSTYMARGCALRRICTWQSVPSGWLYCPECCEQYYNSPAVDTIWYAICPCRLFLFLFSKENPAGKCS